MKTIDTINAILKENRESYFSARKAIVANVLTFERVYVETRKGTLYNTVDSLVREIGYTAAVEVIASMVNRRAWDGRISNYAKAWASAQENAWDEEASNRIGIYSDLIHPTHLNQIAEEMAKYTLGGTAIFSALLSKVSHVTSA